jgi:hypothetical protein
MNTIKDTYTTDMELENDRMIYQSMIDRGCTKQEIDHVFHNLWFYGSVHAPDESAEDHLDLYELVCGKFQFGGTI